MLSSHLRQRLLFKKIINIFLNSPNGMYYLKKEKQSKHKTITIEPKMFKKENKIWIWNTPNVTFRVIYKLGFFFLKKGRNLAMPLSI